MSKPVFEPHEVEQLHALALDIYENYVKQHGPIASHLEPHVGFLSMFQAYCELVGRQKPQ